MGVFKRLDGELRSLGFVPGAPMRRLAMSDYDRASGRNCPECGTRGLEYFPYVLTADYGDNYGGVGGYRPVFRCPSCDEAFEA